MSATASNGANVSINEDPVAGAFGMGMEYFELDTNERKEVIANATTLEEDEWRTLTDRMVQVYQRELNGIQHLREAGLTRNVSLATRIDLWQEISEMTEAEVSMDGETSSEEDRVTYTTSGVPIPITHKDFRIPERVLMTSRRMNNDLRTDEVAAASRVVSEMLEAILFQGWNPQIRDERGDTFTLYGYTNFPDRNTVTGSDWGTAGNIRDDVVSMLDELDKDKRTGGDFWMYLASPQWRELRSAIDPDGDGNLTVRERLNDEFGAEIGRVARSPYVPDGEAVMVDPREDVVELAQAEDMQTIAWQSGSGMTNHYKVMAALAPEIKSDQDSQCGIVHTTGI
jgi:uncharacterized linocin/CFP29 family protein